MFTRRSLIVSASLIVALICTGILATSAHTAQPARPHHSGPAPLSTGIAAISSTVHGDHNLLRFLDVTHYLNTRGFIGGPTLTGQAPIIQDLRLLNVSQVNTLLHFVLPDLPGNAQVYYTHLDGPFLVLPDLPLPILSTLIPSLDNLPALIPHLGNLSWLGLFTYGNAALARLLPLPRLPPVSRMPDLSHAQVVTGHAGKQHLNVQSKSVVLNSAYEVFDAHTGHLLAWG